MIDRIEVWQKDDAIIERLIKKVNEIIDQMNKWEKECIPHEHKPLGGFPRDDLSWGCNSCKGAVGTGYGKCPECGRSI
jgi:hypothetical protein